MKVCKSCNIRYENGKYCAKCGRELEEENPENNGKPKPKKILILLLVVLILGVLTNRKLIFSSLRKQMCP